MFKYLARRILLWTRGRFGNIPHWRSASFVREIPSSGKTDVLIATNVGSYLPGTIVESVIAARLLSRGKSVSVVVCDAALPACMACTKEWLPKIEKFLHNGPDRLMCWVCQKSGPRAFNGLPVKRIKLSDYLETSDRESVDGILAALPFEELKVFQWNGIHIGEHGRAGAIRYLKSDLLLAADHAEELLRRFCAAAMLTAIAYQRILKQHRPSGILAHHGVYVPQGVVTDLARLYRLQLVTWMPSYRRNTVLFASGDTYHKVMVKPLDTNLPVLTAEQTRELRKYLADRETGVADWISFSSTESLNSGILEELELEPTRPIVTLYTNVSWDAQVHFEDNIFEDMFDWLRSTIVYITTRFPKVQVVVRVHPGEVVGQLRSEQPVAQELQQWNEIDFRQIRIVDAKSRISSYSLARLSQFTVIYASKIGIELAARGSRVLVGGEAWVKNKGVSVDPSNREEYFAALEQLIRTTASDVDTRVAEQFAYHVFFRAMRDISSLTTSNGYPPFRILNDITNGSLGTDENLDSVIDYLTGTANQI